MDVDVLDLLVESVLPALRTFELGLHFLANMSPPFEVIIANKEVRDERRIRAAKRSGKEDREAGV